MMRLLNFSSLLLKIVLLIFCFGTQAFSQKEIPESPEKISKEEALKDLKFISKKLNSLSSYQGLNGYDYQGDFAAYQQKIQDSEDMVSTTDFGIFLTKCIGKIGDRHAFAKNYKLPNDLFLPFIVAPLHDKVVALKADKAAQTYALLHEDYPYLSAINGEPILDFLSKIEPEDALAPAMAYHSRAVKKLKYMAQNFALMEQPLPEQFFFTFSNGDLEIVKKMPLESVRGTYLTWDDKITRQSPSKKELDDPVIAKEQFKIDKDNIAYARIPVMLRQKKAPNFFLALQEFMVEAKDSKALIIDIRGNGGGRRDLINEIAGYIVDPKAIHVVNVAQQRCKGKLNKDEKRSLASRYLVAKKKLDARELQAVHAFEKDFKPMYNLPSGKFSKAHYTLFNGAKLSANKYHYQQPVFILMNERSFSAASVFPATFNSLPNVTLVGVTTDGSSGNSESFFLPNSKVLIKLSTMVSFQKDGKILDGYGTKPAIEIQRTLEQLFWKEDNQLLNLKTRINEQWHEGGTNKKAN